MKGLDLVLDVIENDFKGYSLHEEDHGIVGFFVDRQGYTLQGQYYMRNGEVLFYESLPVKGPNPMVADIEKQSISTGLEKEMNHMITERLNNN